MLRARRAAPAPSPHHGDGGQPVPDPHPGGADAAAGTRRARRPRMGTAGRLAAFHALVIATVLTVVVLQLTRAFSDRYRTTVTRDLGENVSAFTEGASLRPRGQTLAAFSRSFLAAHGEEGGDVIVISLPSQPAALGTPGSQQLAALPEISALLRRPPPVSVLRQLHVGAVPEEVLATPVVEGGRRVGTFVTAGSLAAYEATRARVVRLAIGEGLVALVAAMLSAYLLLRRLLGSVDRLTRAARQIGLGGQLDVRLGDNSGRDEVGEMSATFDAMIDKIDNAMSMQRRLLTDVSHQLRTPLTVMRGHLEILSRGPMTDPQEVEATTGTVIAEVDHMRTLVERLLLLGRSLEADFVELGPVDLRAMLADIAEAARVLAPRHWKVGPVPDLVIRADLDKLRGAVLNLVENSVKATDPQATIETSAALGEADRAGWVDIFVDDSGPGIPVEQRDMVLGRFSRPSAPEAGSSGLGLAIVEAVARAHGGGVVVGDSPLGGCRVTISLPVTGDGRPGSGGSEGEVP